MRPDEIHTELDQLWRDRHEDPPDTADQIRDELERLDRGVGSENFSDREKRIWNALNAKLEHKIREERIRELADRGGDNVETTDHRPGGGHESERTLNPALARRQPELSEALRAIDRHADSFRHQRDAHRLEQHLRHEDVGSFDARYVAAVAEPAYRTAFRKLLRGRDRVDFTPEEREAVERYRGAENVRTMTEGTGALGGFGVPFDLDPSMNLVSDGAQSPIRGLANVRQISGRELRLVNTTGGTATYEAELTQVTESPPPLTQPVVYAAKWQSYIEYSIELEQDYASLESELQTVLVDARDTLDATQFLTGAAGASGTAPDGVLTGLNTAGTAYRTTVTSANWTAGGTAHATSWYALKQSVPPRFLPRASFVAAPAVLDRAYRAVGGDSPEPAILPERDGALLGKPANEWTTMNSGTASGQKVAVYGDFTAGYTLVDRIGMSVELVPHVLGANHRPVGARGLYAYGRPAGRWLRRPRCGG